jgi:uncharacterized protein
MTTLLGPAQRLTVMVKSPTPSGTARCAPRSCTERTPPASSAASICHGVEGFAARSPMHTTRILSPAEDLPICVDTAERVQASRPTSIRSSLRRWCS